MKKIILCLWILASCFASVAARSFQSVSSPNGRLKMSVSIGNLLKLTLYCDGKDLMETPISMKLDDNTVWGSKATLQKATRSEPNRIISTSLYTKSQVTDHCNELTLKFTEGFNLVVRAYDNGCAYRFVSDKIGAYNVKDETTLWSFPTGAKVTYRWAENNGGEQGDLYSPLNSHGEGWYIPDTTTIINDDNRPYALLPFMVKSPNRPTLVLAESDIEDYPSMFVQNVNGGIFAATFPQKAKTSRITSPWCKMTFPETRYPYIASCNGPRTFPWRIFMVADEDVDLFDNDLVYVLAKDPEGDFSWVKNGQSTMDYLTAYTLDNVKFQSGLNTQTYLYEIDFAAKHRMSYVNMDSGVLNDTTMMSVKTNSSGQPAVDMSTLSAEAKAKNVKLVVWGSAGVLNAYLNEGEDKLDACMAKVAELGFNGIKIDYFERSDQDYNRLKEAVLRSAAKHHLVVLLHGTYEPAGYNRTWPNLVSSEGVRGMEDRKWNMGIGQYKYDRRWVYDVTFPFLRCLNGPTDYTPGLMRNATVKTMKVSNERPMSLGTRSHQIAMFIVLFSPLTNLGDNVTSYESQPAVLNYINAIPTTWDDVKSISGVSNQYLAVARRKGDQWFIGALNNDQDRALTLDLSFLDDGDYVAKIFTDAVNTDVVPTNYRIFTIDIPADRKLTINMKKIGGWVARIYKKSSSAVDMVKVDKDYSASVYNLAGQKVGITKSALQRGIYIAEGKKFIVK
jgi:alpha-glucosidase